MADDTLGRGVKAKATALSFDLLAWATAHPARWQTPTSPGMLRALKKTPTRLYACRKGEAPCSWGNMRDGPPPSLHPVDKRRQKLS
jgi:hypothetical protein